MNDGGECCAPLTSKKCQKHTLECSRTIFGWFWNFWFLVKIWLTRGQVREICRRFRKQNYIWLHQSWALNTREDVYEVNVCSQVLYKSPQALEQLLKLHLRWTGFSALRAPHDERQRRVLRTIYMKKLSKTYSRIPQKSFCVIWELFDFWQILVHERPKSGKIVNGFVCKFQFECINLERYNLVRTSEKSIFAVQCNTSHHKP